MKVKAAQLSVLFLVTVLPLLQARSSQAVPAFARREGAKCQMCHFRLPELNEDGHSYIRRGLREAREGMAPQTGMDMGTKDMGTRDQPKTPVASTARPLGEALPLEWQHYLTVMGHQTYEAHSNSKAAFHPGEIEGWIGGPFDPHWSGFCSGRPCLRSDGPDTRATTMRTGRLLSEMRRSPTGRPLGRPSGHRPR